MKSRIHRNEMNDLLENILSLRNQIEFKMEKAVKRIDGEGVRS